MSVATIVRGIATGEISSILGESHLPSSGSMFNNIFKLVSRCVDILMHRDLVLRMLLPTIEDLQEVGLQGGNLMASFAILAVVQATNLTFVLTIGTELMPRSNLIPILLLTILGELLWLLFNLILSLLTWISHNDSSRLGLC
jgi:hypothetical protein